MRATIPDNRWAHIQANHPEITRRSIYEALEDPYLYIRDPWKANCKDNAYAIIGYSTELGCPVVLAINKDKSNLLLGHVESAWVAEGDDKEVYFSRFSYNKKGNRKSR